MLHKKHSISYWNIRASDKWMLYDIDQQVWLTKAKWIGTEDELSGTILSEFTKPHHILQKTKNNGFLHKQAIKAAEIASVKTNELPIGISFIYLVW